MKTNWYQIKVSALTVIRAEWPVKKLQVMAAGGHETPASGDALTRLKMELRSTKEAPDDHQ